MNIINYGKNLDGRDELILGLIAGFIPLLTLVNLIH
jgi:hypothetical protein